MRVLTRHVDNSVPRFVRLTALRCSSVRSIERTVPSGFDSGRNEKESLRGENAGDMSFGTPFLSSNAWLSTEALMSLDGIFDSKHIPYPEFLTEALTGTPRKW